MNTQLKTLMGLSVSELQTQLDAEFPAAAYKRIPGAMDLTDIDPAYMRRCITKVFGLCGVGWGYRFDPQAVQIREASNKGLDVAITGFVFWYKLTDGTAEHVFEIPVVGGSVNKTTAYALKGALTYGVLC